MRFLWCSWCTTWSNRCQVSLALVAAVAFPDTPINPWDYLPAMAAELQVYIDAKSLEVALTPIESVAAPQLVSIPNFLLANEVLLPSARRCLTGSASSFFQSAERNESSMVGNLNVRWLGSPRRLSTRHYASLDARVFLKHPNPILLAERWFHSLWSLRIPLP